MSVHTILRYGDQRLLQVSEAVTTFDTPELHQLIEDMRDTMQAHSGAGLAAPQIGIFQQVVIFGIEQNPRYPDVEPVPETVLINPKIAVLGDQVSGMWEGCLSVPGMRGYVERPSHIHYSGYDQFGEIVSREVTGFHAIVVQHECDHLDGILYPMRIKDMRQFGFIEDLEKGAQR